MVHAAVGERWGGGVCARRGGIEGDGVRAAMVAAEVAVEISAVAATGVVGVRRGEDARGWAQLGISSGRRCRGVQPVESKRRGQLIR